MIAPSRRALIGSVAALSLAVSAHGQGFGSLLPAPGAQYIPTGNLQFAGGFKRVVAGYNGPLVAIRNGTGGGGGVNYSCAAGSDYIDIAALDAALGILVPGVYPQGTIEKIYDQSGNGNDLTVNGDPPQIGIYAQTQIGGHPAGRTRQRVGDSTSYFIVPAGVSVSGQAFSVFVAGRPTASAQGAESVFELGSSTNLINLFKNLTFNSGSAGLLYNINSNANTTTAQGVIPRCQPTVVGMVGGVSSAAIYIDGNPTAITPGTATACAGGMICGGSNGSLESDFLTACIYGRPLSPTEATSLTAAMLPLQPVLQNRLIVWDGDSITYGNGCTFGQNQISAVAPLLNASASQYNLGIGSQTLQTIQGAFASRAALLFKSGLDKPPVYHIWGGTNDIAVNGTSGATTWSSYLSPLCTAAKAAGFKVVCATTLPRGTTAQQTQITALNALINAAVGSNIDAVADVASDAIMGNASNLANTTYYADTIHPTTFGYSVLAPYSANAINSLG